MRDVYRDNSPPRLLKVCGSDFELGNFILGLDDPGGSGREASRALLAAIKGLPHRPLVSLLPLRPSTGSPPAMVDAGITAFSNTRARSTAASMSRIGAGSSSRKTAAVPISTSIIWNSAFRK